MKNVIITGANSGLGFETAKKIAKQKDWRLILACRNLQKAEKARDEIIQESKNSQVYIIAADTSCLASMREFAQEYAKSGFGKIDALLCNAGISGTHSGLTADGFDVVFETNHLGHFYLTNLLLPYFNEEGLIFSTSSDMHDAPSVQMSWPQTEALAHPDASLAQDRIRYSYSKLCNLYFVYELADRLNQAGSKIKANAFNPGLMKTGFMPLLDDAVEFVRTTMPERYGDLEESSKAYARLVTEKGLVSESGLYYDRSIRTTSSSALSYNKENAKELWRKSAQYTGL